jgi:sugar phosphate isomerase/epimerase
MDNIIGASSVIYDPFGAEEAFKSVAANGFKFIEVTYLKGFAENIVKRPEDISKKDIEDMLAMAKNYGLSIYAFSVYEYIISENAVDKFKKIIDVANSLGSHTIITDTGDAKEGESDKIDLFYKNIAEIAEYASSNDTNICFEIHGGLCSTGRQGVEIVKKIDHPNIKLNYDTANVIYFGGERPEEDIVGLWPYFGFMHLKDKAGRDPEWNFPAVGDGNIDFKKIFEEIKDYSGPISVEIELTEGKHSLQEVNGAFKKSYDFVKSLGFKI